MAKLLQNSGTRLLQLMNTSGFHRKVGKGNKSFNAMSYLSKALVKGLAVREYDRQSDYCNPLTHAC